MAGVVRRDFWLDRTHDLSQLLDCDEFVQLPHEPQGSSLFYCGHCGWTYAKVVVEGAEFQAFKSLCKDCKFPWHNPPGSIWKSWDHPYLNSLPREVLLYEFELHWKHYIGEV